MMGISHFLHNLLTKIINKWKNNWQINIMKVECCIFEKILTDLKNNYQTL